MATASCKPSEPNEQYLHGLLNEPETESLLRLTRLAEHLYHVPVAYMALLDSSGKVVTRIGAGHENGRLLGRMPLDDALQNPTCVPDTAAPGLPELDFGELRFIATAPLRTSDGLTLGLLAIADRQPRPAFSEEDLASLAELARVLAGKMELRRIAAHALQSEVALREMESRFRALANAAPVLMACSGPDGAVTFVNRACLEFTGRQLGQDLGDGWCESLHPEFRAGIAEQYWKALTARQPFVMELPLRRHDGHYRKLRLQAEPRFRENGSFAGFIGCLTDLDALTK